MANDDYRRNRSHQHDVDRMFEQVGLHGVNLTPWEEDFIESARDQWAAKRSLSDKQLEILERIYAQRTP